MYVYIYLSFLNFLSNMLHKFSKKKVTNIWPCMIFVSISLKNCGTFIVSINKEFLNS